jgi:hypothetical protein
MPPNDTHMIGAYATFIFMIFLLILPFAVVKFVKKRKK